MRVALENMQVSGREGLEVKRRHQHHDEDVAEPGHHEDIYNHSQESASRAGISHQPSPQTGQVDNYERNDEDQLHIHKQRQMFGARRPNFTLFSSRRRSSGTRRVSSGQHKTLFANPQDKIYEDPHDNSNMGAQDNAVLGRTMALQENVTQQDKHNILALSNRTVTEGEHQPTHDTIPVKQEPTRMRRNPFARMKSMKNLRSVNSTAEQVHQNTNTHVPASFGPAPLPHPGRFPKDAADCVHAQSGPTPALNSKPINALTTPTTIKGDHSTTTLSGESIITLRDTPWSDLPTPSKSSSALVPQPLHFAKARTNPVPQVSGNSPTPMPSLPEHTLPQIMVSSEDDTGSARLRNTQDWPLSNSHNSHTPLVPRISISPDIPTIQIGTDSSPDEEISIPKFPLPPSITVLDFSASEDSGPQKELLTFAFNVTAPEEDDQSVSMDKRNQRPPKTKRTHLENAWRPASSTGLLCSNCALPISGKSVTASSARFHPDCFVCYHCQTGLECVAFYAEPETHRQARLEQFQDQMLDPERVIDAYSDLDDSLRFYCHLDYHELFSPRCKSCKTPIEKDAIDACGAQWHQGHFFCAQCGDVS